MISRLRRRIERWQDERYRRTYGIRRLHPGLTEETDPAAAIWWNDISPGDRCMWVGCDEEARWITPGHAVADYGLEVQPGHWCDTHHRHIASEGDRRQ